MSTICLKACQKRIETQYILRRVRSVLKHSTCLKACQKRIETQYISQGVSKRIEIQYMSQGVSEMY